MRDVAGAGVGAGLARCDVAAAHQRLPWDAIAEQFPGRSANNLRTAWVGRLAPALLSRPGVGPGEDVALLEALEAPAGGAGPRGGEGRLFTAGAVSRPPALRTRAR